MTYDAEQARTGQTGTIALAKMTYDAEQARTGQTGTLVMIHSKLLL